MDHKTSDIADELADILIYCVLMAYACDLDIEDIMQAKLAKNKEKYPVEKAYGNKDKYTEL